MSRRSDAPSDSSRLERFAAVLLRTIVLLLVSYVAIRAIFPFGLVGLRVGDMTGAEFLLLNFRAVISVVAAGYFLTVAFRIPPLRDRNRVFCERWAMLGLGITSVIGCAFVSTFVKGDGFPETMARLIGKGILSLLI